MSVEAASGPGEVRPPAAPVVSVVTPLYNSSLHTDATLHSLQAQTFTYWEAILVDDGSADDAPRRIQRFLADSRFQLGPSVRSGNSRRPKPRHPGARGTWISFLDHDDRWRPDKLARQLDAGEHRGWTIVCTDAVVVREADHRCGSPT